MIRGAVPLSIEFRPLIAPAPIQQQPAVAPVIASETRVEQPQPVAAPIIPPALTAFPGRRNPMTPATALPDRDRPVGYLAPLPTMAMPVE